MAPSMQRSSPCHGTKSGRGEVWYGKLREISACHSYQNKWLWSESRMETAMTDGSCKVFGSWCASPSLREVLLLSLLFRFWGSGYVAVLETWIPVFLCWKAVLPSSHTSGHWWFSSALCASSSWCCSPVWITGYALCPSQNAWRGLPSWEAPSQRSMEVFLPRRAVSEGRLLLSPWLAGHHAYWVLNTRKASLSL